MDIKSSALKLAAPVPLLQAVERPEIRQVRRAELAISSPLRRLKVHDLLVPGAMLTCTRRFPTPPDADAGTMVWARVISVGHAALPRPQPGDTKLSVPVGGAQEPVRIEATF